MTAPPSALTPQPVPPTGSARAPRSRLAVGLLTALLTAALLALTPTPAGAAPKIPRDPSNVGVLVNKKLPLKPKSYVPRDLVSVAGARVRKEPAKHLKTLMRDAKRAKAPIVIVSSYRSYSTQKSLFARYSRLYGAAYASRIAARPGHSEHQTGLTVDVGAASGRCRLGACFGGTSAGAWVAKNAWKYGYIVRYPKGQEKRTGYAYEPWHLRYVGKKIATTMKKQRIPTLEAYYGVRG